MDTLQYLKHLLFIQATNQSKILFVWPSEKNIFALKESCFYPLHSVYSHQLCCLISEAQQKSTEIIKWYNISQSNTLSFMDSIYFVPCSVYLQNFLISNHEIQTNDLQLLLSRHPVRHYVSKWKCLNTSVINCAGCYIVLPFFPSLKTHKRVSNL